MNFHLWIYKMFFLFCHFLVSLIFSLGKFSPQLSQARTGRLRPLSSSLPSLQPAPCGEEYFEVIFPSSTCLELILHGGSAVRFILHPEGHHLPLPLHSHLRKTGLILCDQQFIIWPEYTRQPGRTNPCSN